MVLLGSEVYDLEVNSLELVELGRHGAHMVPHFIPSPRNELPLDVGYVNKDGMGRECGVALWDD